MHQPNYIPWIGYFYKMMKSDIFVYLDAVQYPRGRSFAARNRIKTPNGPVFLTIPVSVPKGKDGKVSYREIQFSSEAWHEKHLKTLAMNYKKAPYFEEIYIMLENEVIKDHSFVEMNMALLNTIADYLQIDTEFVLLSELLREHGQKTDLIIDLCNKLGVDTYLSGTGGGKSYNDEEKLNGHGINLIYSDFKHPEYRQLWGGFEPHLSIVDLLFNHGKDSIQIMSVNQ